MIAAANASRQLGHDYIGSEHLLLALAEEVDSPAGQLLASHGLSPERVRARILELIGTGGPPRSRLDADALATLGIDLDAVRRQVERSFGEGALERTWAGCKPVAPRLKRALELAAREAGDGPIGPAHALLGLARVEGCVAAEIMAAHGITGARVRAAYADG